MMPKWFLLYMYVNSGMYKQWPWRTLPQLQKPCHLTPPPAHSKLPHMITTTTATQCPAYLTAKVGVWAVPLCTENGHMSFHLTPSLTHLHNCLIVHASGEHLTHKDTVSIVRELRQWRETVAVTWVRKLAVSFPWIHTRGKKKFIYPELSVKSAWGRLL